MANLTREQADKEAQKLADKTGEPHIIWSLPVWESSFEEHYRVVSRQAASSAQHLQAVDCKWPKEA